MRCNKDGLNAPHTYKKKTYKDELVETLLRIEQVADLETRSAVLGTASLMGSLVFSIYHINIDRSHRWNRNITLYAWLKELKKRELILESEKLFEIHYLANDIRFKHYVPTRDEAKSAVYDTRFFLEKNEKLNIYQTCQNCKKKVKRSVKQYLEQTTRRSFAKCSYCGVLQGISTTKDLDNINVTQNDGSLIKYIDEWVEKKQGK